MLLFCIIASYCAINQWYVISPCCVIYNSWIYRNISICYFFAFLHHIVQYINDMWLHHIVWYAIPEFTAMLTMYPDNCNKNKCKMQSCKCKLLIVWLHYMLQWIDNAMIFHHVLQYVTMNLQEYSYNLHFT